MKEYRYFDTNYYYLDYYVIEDKGILSGCYEVPCKLKTEEDFYIYLKRFSYEGFILYIDKDHNDYFNFVDVWVAGKGVLRVNLKSYRCNSLVLRALRAKRYPYCRITGVYGEQFGHTTFNIKEIECPEDQKELFIDFLEAFKKPKYGPTKKVDKPYYTDSHKIFKFIQRHRKELCEKFDLDGSQIYIMKNKKGV